MAADVALNPALAAPYPFCRLSGPANVLVMPAFHSASISTKMLQELGGATVIGPLLVGLDRPVQIVQLGAKDNQLVNMAALAAYNVSGYSVYGRMRVSKTLSGVIAAVATPVDETGAPDIARAVKLARYLLDNGCDGLNVLGTTGEATSFSREERMAVMSAYKAQGLPLNRLMVGTGAAATADAVALTRHAAELGFGGALVLPPFYYKGVPDDGLVAYIDTLVKATADKPIPIYLYHFPAMSGLAWHVALIKRLLDLYPDRIVGLKDSSGDMAYARSAAAVAKNFAVFPSTEACLIEARSGAFAGCISATANLNADLCARAWAEGDTAALDAAVAIRKLFDGKPLVAGVKALLAHIHGDPTLARVKPPLAPLSAADRTAVTAGNDAVRAKRVA
jgi:4-hydroxy-tetrahydrodipicolinate synthase